ncbi:hypothetical protein NQZ68_008241 [Dissostichus eleginoides]|nr:hypothetical protein NQZ68_008241 [Dissostichus eleginoides]
MFVKRKSGFNQTLEKVAFRGREGGHECISRNTPNFKLLHRQSRLQSVHSVHSFLGNYAKYQKEEDRQGSATSSAAEGKSVRAVAKSHDICHVTLYRFHKKRLRLEGSKSPQRVGYWTPKKVFSTEQEMLLRDYLMEAADLYYGLSSKEPSISSPTNHTLSTTTSSNN